MNLIMKFIELDHTDPTQSERIRRVLFDAYSIEAGLIGVADFPPLRRSAANIRNTQSTFFSYTHEGELIAVAEIERERAQQANIASFVVHPNFFRKGIGSQLLRHVVELLGNTLITVSTASKNRPAIALYEKHGFQISESWTTECQIEMVTLSRNEGL
jgi:ribosomal protein S18 acetylase RimI-like enzyme